MFLFEDLQYSTFLQRENSVNENLQIRCIFIYNIYF
jgi:hypothetical protein